MKPGTITAGRTIAAVFIVAATLTLVSWDFRQSPGRTPEKRIDTDTIPQKKKDRKVRDLDEAIQQLDEVDFNAEMKSALDEVNRSMKEIDGEKIRREVELAIKEVNIAEIQREVQAALKEVNSEKIQKEIAKALKEIDAVKINKEVQDALKEIDVEKIQREVKESMAKIDLKEININLEELKDLKLENLNDEMKKMNVELAKIGPEVRKSLEGAKVEIERVKAEMKEYKKFVDGLDADGVINKKADYSLISKDGKLLINGKEASAEVYKKYDDFLNDHKNFKITKDGDDFDMDLD